MGSDEAKVDRATPAFGGVGLLIVDMINDLSFDGAEAMRKPAVAASAAIRRLRDQADALKIPTVYVNDNYGQWHSERSRILEYCRARGGGEILAGLEPRADDYFVIKPQFSGFYATNLPVLLPKLGVSRLVLTGIAADICILFTAADAHMRAYDLWAPRDAVASSEPRHCEWALQIMQKSMGAEIAASGKLALEEWAARKAERPDLSSAAKSDPA